MSNPTGPQAGLKGIVEDLKGKAKEALGGVLGDQRTAQEGRAQQRKADAQRDVAEAEAKAEVARAEAEVHEADQRRHQ